MNDIMNILDDKKIAPSGVKMTEPKLLSECGELLVVDGTPGEQYQVGIEPGEFLVVRAGATADKVMARFEHPNVAASARVIHEFKHYRRNGGKFWTARAGVDFYFVIPRSAITMLPEKGYSYVPAMINGVKVKFNVSGGTSNGWTDWLHTSTTISVNHGIRDLKKIAEVAVRNSPFEPLTPKALEPDRVIQWERLAARVAKGLIEKIAKLAEEGKKPVVKFLPGYGLEGVHEGKIVDVIRRPKKIMLPHGDECQKKWKVEYTGAVKSLLLEMESAWGKVRAKVGQIDWAATAEANGLGRGVAA